MEIRFACVKWQLSLNAVPLLLAKKENYSFDLMEIVDEDFSYLK